MRKKIASLFLVTISSFIAFTTISCSRKINHGLTSQPKDKETDKEENSSQFKFNKIDRSLYEKETFSRPELTPYDESRYLEVIQKHRRDYNPNNLPKNTREWIIFSIFDPYGFSPKSHFGLAAFLFEENAKIIKLFDETIQLTSQIFQGFSFFDKSSLSLNGYLQGSGFGLLDSQSFNSIFKSPQEMTNGEVILNPKLEKDSINGLKSFFEQIATNSAKNMDQKLLDAFNDALDDINFLYSRTDDYIDLSWSLVFDKIPVDGTDYHKLVPRIKHKSVLKINTKSENFRFSLGETYSGKLESEIYTRKHFDYRPSKNLTFNRWLENSLNLFKPSLIRMNLFFYSPELFTQLGFWQYIQTLETNPPWKSETRSPILFNIQSSKEITYCYTPFKERTDFRKALGDINDIFLYFQEAFDNFNLSQKIIFQNSPNKNIHNYGTYFKLLKDESNNCKDYNHKIIGWDFDSPYLQEGSPISAYNTYGSDIFNSLGEKEYVFYDSNSTLRNIWNSSIHINPNYDWQTMAQEYGLSLSRTIQDTIEHELLHTFGLRDNYLSYSRFNIAGLNIDEQSSKSANHTYEILNFLETKELLNSISSMQYAVPPSKTFKIGSLDLFAIAYSNEIAENLKFRKI
jgi:hypothetical protein